MDAALIGALAASAVGVVTNFLSKASEGAAKKVGESVFELVKARLGQRVAAKEALDDLVAEPAREDLAVALKVQLEKALKADQQFAHVLSGLVGAANQSESVNISQIAGNNSEQIGYVRGNITKTNT